MLILGSQAAAIPLQRCVASFTYHSYSLGYSLSIEQRTAMEVDSASSEQRTAMQTGSVSRHDLKMILFQGADKIQKMYKEFRIYFPNILMSEIGLTDQFMMEVAKYSGKAAIWVSLLYNHSSRKSD